MFPQKSDSAPRRHCASCSCLPRDNEIDVVNTVEAADAIMLLLQDDIKNRLRELAQLTQKRNQLLPIGRLSPELLCEIFLYYRDVQTLPSTAYIKRLPWLPAIHTCAHWRAVVLADVRFWSTPNLRFPLFVHHFADRFCAAPLRVMLSACEYNFGCPKQLLDAKLEKYGISAVLSNANPIVALDLNAHSEELARCLKNLLPRAASEVRSIHLGTGPDEYSEPIPMDDLGYLEPGVDCLPSLQVLSLHAVKFEWASLLNNCIRTLRELTFTHCDIPSSQMEALAQIPHLVKLVFHDTYTYLGAVYDTTTIFLPALAELYLRNEDMEWCASLLERFRLPAGCFTSIMPNMGRIYFLPAIVRCITAPDPSVVRVMLDDDGFELQCELGSRVNYFLRLPQEDISTAEALRAFACGFESRPSVLEVSVRRGEWISAKLALLLAEAYSVHTFTICGQGDFLGALAECLCTREKMLPQLERLEVRDADFTQLEPTAIQQWMDALNSRSGMLKTVVTVGCVSVPASTQACDVIADS